MMPKRLTPQEHYDEAVRLLGCTHRTDVPTASHPRYREEALIHATLALYDPAVSVRAALLGES